MTLPFFSFLIQRININHNISINTSCKLSKSRRGVSPVIATTIILAITVTLGLSLWSFANAGVGTATQQYADVVTDYGKFTSDKFVIPSVAFDYPNPPNSDDLTIWVYNSGDRETTIQTVNISCKDCAVDVPPVILTADDLLSGDPDEMQIPTKYLLTLSFDASAAGAVFTPGDTYKVQVISETGAYQTVFQKAE
jgi:flagellin-like protein